MIKLLIYGRPVSQKNSRKIIQVKGRLRVAANSRVAAWHTRAIPQLRNQWGKPPIPKRERVAVRIKAYLGRGQAIDVDNLAAAPLDALQAAGVLTNDYQADRLWVERHRDADNPRYEIEIERGPDGDDTIPTAQLDEPERGRSY